MAKDYITLAGLANLDGGRIAEAFRLEVEKTYADLDDRPAVKAARTITIKVLLTPEQNEAGRLELVNVDCEIDSKLPRRKSRTYSARHDGQGLTVSLFAPEHPDQRTIDEVLHGEDDRNAC